MKIYCVEDGYLRKEEDFNNIYKKEIKKRKRFCPFGFLSAGSACSSPGDFLSSYVLSFTVLLLFLFLAHHVIQVLSDALQSIH